MQPILSLSPPLLLVALIVFVAIGLAGALALLRFAVWRIGHTAGHVPVPAFLGIVSTAWALSLGFAASDVWSLGAQADQAAANERSAITRLLGVSEPNALDLPEMHEAMLAYVHLVENNEWHEHRNQQADPEVDAALQTIRLAIIEMTRENVAGALVNKAVRDFDELQDARNARLAIGQSAVDESKWYLVLSLTLLTMATIAIIHADHPKAGRNALAIYGVVVVVSLWILAIHTNPYGGPTYTFAIAAGRERL